MKKIGFHYRCKYFYVMNRLNPSPYTYYRGYSASKKGRYRYYRSKWIYRSEGKISPKNMQITAIKYIPKHSSI